MHDGGNLLQFVWFYLRIKATFTNWCAEDMLSSAQACKEYTFINLYLRQHFHFKIIAEFHLF